MNKWVIAIILSLFPLSIAPAMTPYERPVTGAFANLLMTCINSSQTSIWIDHKVVGYFECKRIPYPKRFPR